jgi:hypothetical protein
MAITQATLRTLVLRSESETFVGTHTTAKPTTLKEGQYKQIRQREFTYSIPIRVLNSYCRQVLVVNKYKHQPKYIRYSRGARDKNGHGLFLYRNSSSSNIIARLNLQLPSYGIVTSYSPASARGLYPQDHPALRFSLQGNPLSSSIL